MIRNLGFLVIALLGVSGQTAAGADDDYYLFTSFKSQEKGLFLLYSKDGHKWSWLNDGKPWLVPEGNGSAGNPFLCQGPDGAFHAVWNGSIPNVARGNSFVYARSTDLLRWELRQIYVMENEPKTVNVWAPEIFYDEGKSQWLIFWTSTVKGRFPETDGQGGNQYNHRIYAKTTRDFKTFSESRLFFDPGYSVIDATIMKIGRNFYLFFKDERRMPKLHKYVRCAVSDRPEGPYTDISEPVTEQWTEGPSAIQIGEYLYVYSDHFGGPQHYCASRSKDLKNWEVVTDKMSFPAGHRHGTVLRVSKDIIDRLLANKGALGSSVAP